MAVFIGFMVFSNRKRKKQAQTMTESIQVGVEVVMLGGITGKVVAVKEGSVVIESTPGTKIEFMKAAVRNVVPATAKTDEITQPVKKAAATKSATATATKKPATKPAATNKTSK
jgi:preprotein translocase subunit YajC